MPKNETLGQLSEKMRVAGKRLQAAIESDRDDVVEAASLYADAVTAYRQLVCSSIQFAADEPRPTQFGRRSPNGV